MSVIIEPQRTKLYTRVKHLLGAPIRSIEIEDEMMDSLLAIAIVLQNLIILIVGTNPSKPVIELIT